MKNIGIVIKLTLILLIICAGIFPLFIALVGKLEPNGGKGETIIVNGKAAGYANVGQKFTADKYFWSRPSVVEYNAAGSAGSNKGATNADYLKTVQDRIDTFLVHNPGIEKSAIPAEMVTASGSGLDPDISPASAYVQIKRIAAMRSLPEDQVRSLVEGHVEKPLFGILGPSKINVLKLNVALDALSANKK
ncbi:K(+)-transporting ATPase subunit C [Niastella caeni]|uniref:Potassium-transporting ATPase KdpC subunit n=1 Tax=Niastella caeni TaxID=2569763 RepID=A0A4S8HX38_9BACT|nr:K(+)-transporting ATPase subunit C [Niastella caeni]THU40273.1 K(+)-transporting ATPase subunit C [Niastella caeni]